MKKKLTHLKFALCFASLLVFAACNDGTTETETTTSDSTTHENTTGTAGNTGPAAAEATISTVKADTTVQGTAQFEQIQDGRVRLNMEVTIPTKANQSVAAHIHQNGDCGNNAEAAGPHWNPTSHEHGKWGEGAFHSGDLGNIQLDGQGRGTIQLESDRWSIGGDEQKNILNKSIIIHTGTDDFKSQPSGNAGGRIGCGIIRQKQ